MILVTDVELRGCQEVISGVLLDPLPPGGYSKGVFNAFLSSDLIREIVCEAPKYQGGHGHTSDGLLISEFSSQLRGECVYAHEPPSTVGILTKIVENRIELVTSANLHGCVFPAFLAPESVSRPVSTRVVVKLEITRFGSFPDMQAFAVTDPLILNEPLIDESIKCETILPVHCLTPGTSFAGALKLLTQLSPTEFQAEIYHEHEKGPVIVGSVFDRTVIKQKRGSQSEPLKFFAKIGTIVSVQ